MKTQETHEERSAKEEAMGFLEHALKSGRVPQNDLEKEWKKAGHSESTIKRAKYALGVKSVATGFGTGWAWELPQQNLPARKKSGISVTCECGEPKQIVGEKCDRCGITVTDVD